MVILLIPLVVAVNIFHSLRRSVFERHEEIGLLRALGASPRQVQGIFLIEGALIGLLGALIGLCLGLAIAYNVNGVFLAFESIVNWVLSALNAIVDPVAPRGSSFSFFSPAFFYLSEVPVRVYFPEALFSFLFAFASSAGSAYLASGAVSRFQPQEILRYE
jgi:lipoprotein-releasing system permease protein